MRVPLVLFAILPLLLCSCPYYEEERLRERQVDEDLFGCRSCHMVEIRDAENCPVGYECKSEWQLTSNVLSPNDCSCSELRCANKSAILAVDQQLVGKIRCKAREWTLLNDPSQTATSAVCAKACGTKVCKPKPLTSQYPHYTALPVNEPSSNGDYCANAHCPHGIAVFNDAQGFEEIREDTTYVVCSSSGKWTFGVDEARNVMCLGCRSGVCKPNHASGVGNPLYYDLLPVDPSDPTACSTAECPHGIAVFQGNGLPNIHTGATTLVCSGNGKWKYDTNEEEYVMCLGCRSGACAPELPTNPNPDLYSKLEVNDSTDLTACSIAYCPHGIALFGDDEEHLVDKDQVTDLTCMAGGKWKFNGGDQKYVMCLVQCNCLASDPTLADGRYGACAPDTLCVPPSVSACKLECPDNSDLNYVNANEEREETNDKMCAGTDWIQAGSQDITCNYRPGKGQSTEPTTNSCLKLGTTTCPLICDASEIIYTEYKDGTRMTCKKGVLVTKDLRQISVADCVTGTWKDRNGNTITEVNCQKEDLGAGGCSLAAPVAKFSCELGACTGTCRASGRKFEYELEDEGGTETNKDIVKCENNKLYSNRMKKIKNVKCV